MIKQGGYSWNTSVKSKAGVKTKYKCDQCGRQYKIEQMKQRHQKQCREHHESQS